MNALIMFLRIYGYNWSRQILQLKFSCWYFDPDQDKVIYNIVVFLTRGSATILGRGPDVNLEVIGGPG